MSPVRYELGLYIPEDDILHGHHRESIKYYMESSGFLAGPCMKPIPLLR
jgi:hypothetical protein